MFLPFYFTDVSQLILRFFKIHKKNLRDLKNGNVFLNFPYTYPKSD